MKLSQLRPCDKCRGPIGPVFHVVRSSLVVVRPEAARRAAGLAGFFGGLTRPGALALAEAFAPDEHVFEVAGDLDRTLWTELFLCTTCWASPRTQVAALGEAKDERDARAREGSYVGP